MPDGANIVSETEDALLRLLGETWTSVDRDGVVTTISWKERDAKLAAQNARPPRLRDRQPAVFYRTLRAMILEGRKERELLTFAGTSRGALYRAIRRLKREGLIPNTPRNRRLTNY